MIRQLFLYVINTPLGGYLLSIFERLAGKRPNFLQILTYHRVEDPKGFEEQIQYLAANYHIISLSELMEAINGARKLEAGSVMITFDDAYKSFSECAWPVLKKYKVPVILFVPTAFPDSPDEIFWWDRLQHALNNTKRRDKLSTPIGNLSLKTQKSRKRAYKKLRTYVKSLSQTEALAWTYQICTELEAPAPEHEIMDWDTLRKLATEGVTLGAHTRTHPLMNRIPIEEARIEAEGSRDDLEREIGSALPIFAYPDGRFSDEIVEVLKDSGFVLAFTTMSGSNDMRYADLLRLRRNNIGHLTLPVLRARMLTSTMFPNDSKLAPSS